MKGLKRRLEMYETCLKTYKMADSNKWYKIFFNTVNTTRGFCYFFMQKYKLHEMCSEKYFEQMFPELYAQKPKETYSNYPRPIYWFEPGDLKSRIKCLEEAIKLYNSNLITVIV